MPDIVLTTLNAKFIHAAFGLRYLLANLGDLAPRACLAEFDINQRPLDIAEALLARAPRILGFGIYIWNVAETTEVIAAIKRVRPDVTIILGGPEVSYETGEQAIVGLADFVITGEADLAFAEVCRGILAGNLPPKKIIPAALPDFSQLVLPYDLYTEADIAHRVIYVEASRGCPFSCEFCLSSLDIPVRQAPLDELLAALQRLLDRGVTQFKFVDRTFNLNLPTSRALLEFFLARHRPGLFLHFEMIPDRLPEPLREIIARFPPGALQFEVGIQSFNDEVCRLISRRQDVAKLADNFHFLRQRTGVHIHADLIAGLPGESVESFAAGFDRLVRLGPQEIQVGILKRLRGTPIIRHDAEWQMRYKPHPPYDVLQTRLIDFATMQRLRRFAKYWDLVANSGNFVETTPLLWSEPDAQPASPFAAFLAFSDWLHVRVGRTDGIALPRLAEFLFAHLTVSRGFSTGKVAEALLGDWHQAGRRDPPEFLRAHLPANAAAQTRSARPVAPHRQSRHLAAAEPPVAPAEPPAWQSDRRRLPSSDQGANAPAATLRIEPVQSLDAPELALYRTLKRPEEHERAGVLVATNEKVVRRLLASRFPVVSALLTPAWLEKLEPSLRARPEEIRVYVGERALLETITGYQLHQGALAVARIPPQPGFELLLDTASRPLLLAAVEGIASAENLGSVVRGCAAFGVSFLIVGETCGSPFQRRAVSGSMGTIFEQPVVQVENLVATLAALRARGVRCLAAHPRASALELRAADLRGDCCLVFGAEGPGLTEAALAACDGEVKIPMPSHMNSLNVAAAAAVCLYEATRQRG